MFNVGDVVAYGSTQYTVTGVSCALLEVSSMSGITCGWNRDNIFTLVTPAKPVNPVLTGMTQFIKDMESKYESSM